MGNEKKTALYDVHKELGGRIIPFAGYLLPVWYSGIVQEHLAVRKSLGIFDLTHMGEFFLHGKDVLNFLQKLTPNDVSNMVDGQCQYNMLMLPEGGIIDDLIIYRFDANNYMLVVNAANLEKDYRWLEGKVEGDVQLINRSDEYFLIALQGRNSAKLLEDFGFKSASDMESYTFKEYTIAGENAMIASTGYTGELGFEVFIPNEIAQETWKKFMTLGKKYDITPIGLGARDTLRMEVCYPLYGNDIDENTSPLEASLKRFVKLDKGEFIGKDVLQKQQENGIPRKLRAWIAVEEKSQTPRQGTQIFDSEGSQVGVVTSGALGPSVGKSMGMAYIDTKFLPEKILSKNFKDTLFARVRKKDVPIKLTKLGHYKRPY